MLDFPEGSPEPQAGMAKDGFRIVGPVCDARRAWNLLGDTDWMNRAGGNGDMVNMSIESQRDGFPLLKGTLNGPFGLAIPFEEIWSSWVHGVFFRQVRDLKSPLISRTDYRAALEPTEGGVRPVVELRLYGPGWASAVRRGLSLVGLRKKWQATLDRLGESVDTEFPARELTPEATAALTRWRAAGPSLVERFEHHFRTARPTDLARLRAFDLADTWGEDREAVLASLVTAVDAGAAELFWSVRCSRCYGQVAGARLLSDLADHADCDVCKVRTDTDLGSNVEVLFAPHPSVSKELDLNFCTIFPKRAPSQAAVFTLAPGQGFETTLMLGDGQWGFGPGGGRADTVVSVGSHGDTELIRWEPGTTINVRRGAVTLTGQNPDAGRTRFYLTRLGGSPAMVPASLLTTRDDFRRRLGHQVLAPNMRVGVRSVALVFTDLSGSTAMYQELGDARAFAVVRDHFEVLRAEVATHQGSVVKTIGDAVMAAFYDAPSALRAAFAMLDAFNAWVPSLGLDHPPALKVGMHVGSALVVHSEQSGLDYFGATVNLAARAQGAAEAGEVVWTEAVELQPLCQAVVQARGHTTGRLTKTLKGIGEVALFRSD